VEREHDGVGADSFVRLCVRLSPNVRRAFIRRRRAEQLMVAEVAAVERLQRTCDLTRALTDLIHEVAKHAAAVAREIRAGRAIDVAEVRERLFRALAHFEDRAAQAASDGTLDELVTYTRDLAAELRHLLSASEFGLGEVVVRLDQCYGRAVAERAVEKARVAAADARAQREQRKHHARRPAGRARGQRRVREHRPRRSRRTGASSATSGTDPGDPDPEPEPPSRRPARERSRR
jgi:hypothetical protein